MDLREKYCMWMSGSYKKADPRSCYFQFSEREQESQEWVEKAKKLGADEYAELYNRRHKELGL